MRMRILTSVACAACAFLLILTGCKNSQPPAPENVSASKPTATQALPIDAATTGSISGVVRFTGAAMTRTPIDMEMDPACSFGSKEPNRSESVIVNSGALQNVFVYVKTGLEPYAIPSPNQPAVLDQVACRYVPHVLGLVAGQSLQIKNSDNAEHNVHPVPLNNPQWNESQMPKGPPIIHTFPNPELLLPITCNQHPWMKMYVNVVENPFFAVSDAAGRFQIDGLPPGEYTLEAVHEKLGAQRLHIKIEAKQKQEIVLTFSPLAK
jgi:hypothetical protein